MLADLASLHDRKLRDAKCHAERMLNQWQQAIDQIHEEEKWLGYPLLALELAFNMPGELAKQLPTANYLAVVEIRVRAGNGLSETLSYAINTLQEEVRRREKVCEGAQADIVAARTEHEGAISLARHKSQTNSKLDRTAGLVYATIAAVVTEFIACVAMQQMVVAREAWEREHSALEHWERSVLAHSTEGFFWVMVMPILCFAVFLLGWVIGPLICMAIRPRLAVLRANSQFREEKRRLELDFDVRHSNLIHLATKSLSHLQIAQASLARLPVQREVEH